MDNCERITPKLAAGVFPKAALVVYEQESPYYGSKKFVELHTIYKDGRMGPGKPATTKLLRELSEAFSDDYANTPHGPMPSRMLYADTRKGHEVFCWWEPPRKRNMIYAQGNRANVPDGEYNMPGVIYLVRNDSLYVYVFKGKKPSKNEKLLYGPFFNYYNDHKICLGNAEVKKSVDCTWESVMQYWQTMFWNSINSHTICNPMKKGCNLVTELKKSTKLPFDTSKLSESKETLASLLKSANK